MRCHSLAYWQYLSFCFYLGFVFRSNQAHFHYTLSYKRKINIIGKGHLEIGIATYFGWLSSWFHPHTHIQTITNIQPHLLHTLAANAFKVSFRMVEPRVTSELRSLCRPVSLLLSFHLGTNKHFAIYIYLVMIRTWLGESCTAYLFFAEA